MTPCVVSLEGWLTLESQYVTNYLDRNSIAQARVSGLATATHITNEQYSLVNGIFCECRGFYRLEHRAPGYS